MTTPEFTLSASLPHRRQHGIVLIIALIMLVVVSMLAALSMRNASTTEAISGAVRATGLANQAAEVALRYCEESTKVAVGTSTFVTTFTATNVQAASGTPTWQNLATWDSNSTATFVLPAAAVNQSGLAATYNRPPECMVQVLPTQVVAGSPMSTTASFVVTARGFGPEVRAADAGRSRPVGAEVWLQSTIELGTTGATSTSTGGGNDGDYDSN